MGLLVGVTSITVSTAPLPINAVAQEQSESTEDQQEEGDVVLKAFDAITSSVQVSLEHSFTLIDVLPDIEEIKEEFSEIQESLPASDKALKILFRLIISPNAP